jgi:hypothetical protein
MTKKQKMMIVVIIVGIILIVISFWPKKSEEIKIEIQPTPTESQPYFSDTGAKYTPPKANEEKEIEQIRDLRSKLPMDLDKYKIEYDYSNNLFVVKSGEKINLTEFAKVMVENNFGYISKKYFKFE